MLDTYINDMMLSKLSEVGVYVETISALVVDGVM